MVDNNARERVVVQPHVHSRRLCLKKGAPLFGLNWVVSESKTNRDDVREGENRALRVSDAACYGVTSAPLN